MRSAATTVAGYLASLPTDRREIVEALRGAIRRSLGKGYEEGMQYGMIGYYVPHSVYPAGYHCDPRQPLPFAGIASQKNYVSLYVCSIYGPGGEAEWFQQAWARSGKRLDMGKGCVRIRRLEDVPLDVVGEVIRRMPARKLIALHEEALAARGGAAKKPAPKKPAAATRVARAKKAAKRATPPRRFSGTRASRRSE
jgi:hypothetical protein